MPLYAYLQQCERLLRDQKQELVNPEDLTAYVNQARRLVAQETQCLRVLPYTSGQVIGANIVTPGSGYSGSTSLVITAPDYPSGFGPQPGGAQATGSVTVSSGSISAVSISFGGSGYFQPLVTVSDGAGTGATLTPIMTPMNLLLQGQEVYPFTAVDLSPFPGIGSIYAIKSVSIIYANYRYSLPMYSFSIYQSMIRQYPFQYQYVPTFCSQFGQGAAGSLYTYPLPSQTYQMEWDCFCLPSDLLADEDYEPIPLPWTDAIPYYALHLAYLDLQNFNIAKFYLDMYDNKKGRHSRAARVSRAVNPYGRV